MAAANPSKFQALLQRFQQNDPVVHFHQSSQPQQASAFVAPPAFSAQLTRSVTGCCAPAGAFVLPAATTVPWVVSREEALESPRTRQRRARLALYSLAIPAEWLEQGKEEESPENMTQGAGTGAGVGPRGKVHWVLAPPAGSARLFLVEEPEMPAEVDAEEADHAEAEDVEAGDVEAEDVEAEDLEAEDLEAEDVEAEDVEAEDVEAVDVEAVDVEAVDVEAVDVEAVDVEAVDVEADDVEADDVEADDVEADDVEVDDVGVDDAEADDAEADDMEAVHVETDHAEAEAQERGHNEPTSTTGTTASSDAPASSTPMDAVSLSPQLSQAWTPRVCRKTLVDDVSTALSHGGEQWTLQGTRSTSVPFISGKRQPLRWELPSACEALQRQASATAQRLPEPEPAPQAKKVSHSGPLVPSARLLQKRAASGQVTPTLSQWEDALPGSPGLASRPGLAESRRGGEPWSPIQESTGPDSSSAQGSPQHGGEAPSELSDQDCSLLEKGLLRDGCVASGEAPEAGEGEDEAEGEQLDAGGAEQLAPAAEAAPASYVQVGALLQALADPSRELDSDREGTVGLSASASCTNNPLLGRTLTGEAPGFSVTPLAGTLSRSGCKEKHSASLRCLLCGGTCATTLLCMNTPHSPLSTVQASAYPSVASDVDLEAIAECQGSPSAKAAPPAKDLPAPNSPGGGSELSDWVPLSEASSGSSGSNAFRPDNTLIALMKQRERERENMSESSSFLGCDTLEDEERRDESGSQPEEQAWAGSHTEKQAEAGSQTEEQSGETAQPQEQDWATSRPEQVVTAGEQSEQQAGPLAEPAVLAVAEVPVQETRSPLEWEFRTRAQHLRSQSWGGSAPEAVSKSVQPSQSFSGPVHTAAAGASAGPAPPMAGLSEDADDLIADGADSPSASAGQHQAEEAAEHLGGLVAPGTAGADGAGEPEVDPACAEAAAAGQAPAVDGALDDEETAVVDMGGLEQGTSPAGDKTVSRVISLQDLFLLNQCRADAGATSPLSVCCSGTFWEGVDFQLDSGLVTQGGDEVPEEGHGSLDSTALVQSASAHYTEAVGEGAGAQASTEGLSSPGEQELDLGLSAASVSAGEELDPGGEEEVEEERVVDGGEEERGELVGEVREVGEDVGEEVVDEGDCDEAVEDEEDLPETKEDEEETGEAEECRELSGAEGVEQAEEGNEGHKSEGEEDGEDLDGEVLESYGTEEEEEEEEKLESAVVDEGGLVAELSSESKGQERSNGIVNSWAPSQGQETWVSGRSTIKQWNSDATFWLQATESKREALEALWAPDTSRKEPPPNFVRAEAESLNRTLLSPSLSLLPAKVEPVDLVSSPAVGPSLLIEQAGPDNLVAAPLVFILSILNAGLGGPGSPLHGMFSPGDTSADSAASGSDCEELSMSFRSAVSIKEVGSEESAEEGSEGSEESWGVEDGHGHGQGYGHGHGRLVLRKSEGADASGGALSEYGPAWGLSVKGPRYAAAVKGAGQPEAAAELRDPAAHAGSLMPQAVSEQILGLVEQRGLQQILRESMGTAWMDSTRPSNTDKNTDMEGDMVFTAASMHRAQEERAVTFGYDSEVGMPWISIVQARGHLAEVAPGKGRGRGGRGGAGKGPMGRMRVRRRRGVKEEPYQSEIEMVERVELRRGQQTPTDTEAEAEAETEEGEGDTEVEMEREIWMAERVELGLVLEDEESDLVGCQAGGGEGASCVSESELEDEGQETRLGVEAGPEEVDGELEGAAEDGEEAGGTTDKVQPEEDEEEEFEGGQWEEGGDEEGSEGARDQEEDGDPNSLRDVVLPSSSSEREEEHGDADDDDSVPVASLEEPGQATIKEGGSGGEFELLPSSPEAGDRAPPGSPESMGSPAHVCAIHGEITAHTSTLSQQAQSREAANGDSSAREGGAPELGERERQALMSTLMEQQWKGNALNIWTFMLVLDYVEQVKAEQERSERRKKQRKARSRAGEAGGVSASTPEGLADAVGASPSATGMKHGRGEMEGEENPSIMGLGASGGDWCPVHGSSSEFSSSWNPGHAPVLADSTMTADFPAASTQDSFADLSHGSNTSGQAGMMHGKKGNTLLSLFRVGRRGGNRNAKVSGGTGEASPAGVQGRKGRELVPRKSSGVKLLPLLRPLGLWQDSAHSQDNSQGEEAEPAVVLESSCGSPVRNLEAPLMGVGLEEGVQHGRDTHSAAVLGDSLIAEEIIQGRGVAGSSPASANPLAPYQRVQMLAEAQ